MKVPEWLVALMAVQFVATWAFLFFKLLVTCWRFLRWRAMLKRAAYLAVHGGENEPDRAP